MKPASLRITVDGVDRTSLFAAGVDQATADLAGIVQLAEGDHVVSATLQDHAGNTATLTGPFRIDRTGPSGIGRSLSPHGLNSHTVKFAADLELRHPCVGGASTVLSLTRRGLPPTLTQA